MIPNDSIDYPYPSGQNNLINEITGEQSCYFYAHISLIIFLVISNIYRQTDRTGSSNYENYGKHALSNEYVVHGA